MTVAITSHVYADAVQEIIHNPHIVAMYLDMEDDLLSGELPLETLDSFEFMQKANHEFSQRNGSGARYIGTVAEALKKIHGVMTSGSALGSQK